MASTYLSKTLSGSPTDNNKWTWSAWVKRSKLTTEQPLFYADDGGTSYYTRIQWHDTDQISVRNRFAGADKGYAITTPMYRDTASWYHLQVVLDTNNATAGDRIIIYVNGERVTAFDNNPTITQNAGSTINDGYEHRIGRGNNTSGSSYFDGQMSHVHFIDGQAYAPTVFGETDATTGQWKIKTSPSVTYGTNGFFILKDGNSLTDASANSNNFALGGGQITNLKDNPSNNFCNINLLYNQTTGQGVVVNNCGNTVYYASNASRSCFGSIAPSSGKYYFEAKVFGGTGTVVIGIVNMAWSNLNGASGYAFHDDALNFGYNVSGQKTSGGSNTAYGSAISDGDIVGVAMDLDNSKLYFSLNGVFQGSGDPTSGASGTNAAFTLASGANYTAACRLRNGTQVGFNFGNGQYSGSSVVASEGTNASGNGKFEYDVPTGYTALSTKGLNL